MSRLRRSFGKDFKSKVVLEALKEKDTIEVLAKKYELLPSQISLWKAETIRNIYSVFSIEKTSVDKNVVPVEKLYARIGELTLQVDFLKKKLN